MSEHKKQSYGSTVVVGKQATVKPTDDQISNLLEQYKHFADVTLAYWKHLESVNQFFLSLHTPSWARKGYPVRARDYQSESVF
jgi:hypothetical protein